LPRYLGLLPEDWRNYRQPEPVGIHGEESHSARDEADGSRKPSRSRRPDSRDRPLSRAVERGTRKRLGPVPTPDLTHSSDLSTIHDPIARRFRQPTKPAPPFGPEWKEIDILPVFRVFVTIQSSPLVI
jgi:hypothetical protein